MCIRDSVLQCFLLLENDKNKLADAVYRTMVSVDKFINYVHSDGACEEGPSYWGHAAGKMYDYLQLLYDATGGKLSLYTNPLIRNMGEYISRTYVGDGWVVNFADASAKGGGDAGLIFRYGKAIGSDEMQKYAAWLSRKKGGIVITSGRDIFRTLQCLLYSEDMQKTTPVHQTPEVTWYPETQFCYLKNKKGFFLAVKGGYNNESHNHNDVGTFSLYYNAVPVIIDAGVGTYTRQTFGKERYTIWTMQSNYHNLPMINGVPQKFGSEYKATDVVLRLGGNNEEIRMELAFDAMIDKPIDEIAAHMRTLYHGGSGFELEGRRFSAWYADNGIYIAGGDRARYANTARIVSWKDAAKRVGERINAGRFGTELENMEAAGFVRRQVASRLIEMYREKFCRRKRLSALDTGAGADDLPGLRKSTV